jgi:hypothetical protein
MSHLTVSRAASRLLMIGLACAPLVGAKPPERAQGPRIRDETTVVVAGVRELWRLEWESPPKPACGADDAGWYTCPCQGFAFGEAGDLDLVRLRDGEEVERLALTPLFGEQFSDVGPAAIVHRVEPTDGDHTDPEDPGLVDRVAARAPDPILLLADYDRDGQATEFPLQIDVAPCGKRIMVVVGVSRVEPELHVFHSAAHPEQPLAMQLDEWQALRDDELPTKVVDWYCDDHGSPTETELELSAHAGVISAYEREYECDNGERGRMIGGEER